MLMAKTPVILLLILVFSPELYKLVLKFFYTCESLSGLQVFSCAQLFCDPMGCSLPGSSVHGILQTRIPQWLAAPFSRGSTQHRD